MFALYFFKKFKIKKDKGRLRSHSILKETLQLNAFRDFGLDPGQGKISVKDIIGIIKIQYGLFIRLIYISMLSFFVLILRLQLYSRMPVFLENMR